jgi:hypothetical protein
VKRLLIFGFLVIAPFISKAQNYFLGKTDDGIEELYIMSVTNNPSNNTATVVDRLKPVEGRLTDFREKAINTAVKGVKKSDIKEVSFVKRKVQFHSKAKKYRILEINYFENGGKLVEKATFDPEETPWQVIKAGTITEAEFKKVMGK